MEISVSTIVIFAVSLFIFILTCIFVHSFIGTCSSCNYRSLFPHPVAAAPGYINPVSVGRHHQVVTADPEYQRPESRVLPRVPGGPSVSDNRPESRGQSSSGKHPRVSSACEKIYRPVPDIPCDINYQTVSESEVNSIGQCSIDILSQRAHFTKRDQAPTLADTASITDIDIVTDTKRDIKNPVNRNYSSFVRI